MSNSSKQLIKTALKCDGLSGQGTVPGDKSISHRALILGALTVGETKIRGLLESSDVLNTAKAMEAFGTEIRKNKDNSWSIFGVGVGGFSEPNRVIDCGNSGTSVRLIMGAMSTTSITATFTGDHSLVERPMLRIIDPLQQFGARSLSRGTGLLPLSIEGASNPISINYYSPIASAQVKSAVLLAGLNAPGKTIFHEPALSRDHTEKMLEAFGASITNLVNDKGNTISIDGYPELKPQDITIPKDPSSAAFPICAGLIVKDSKIFLDSVCQNPTRNGLLETLMEMGARIEIKNSREINGETVADLSIESSNLRGVDVPPARAVSMIDEYPILAVVAAFANGTTTMRGIKELRVKESDRIATMAKGLKNNGVQVEEGDDYLKIYGKGVDSVVGGEKVQTFFDHRIAMSFLCLGLASQKPVIIDDARSIDTSFPSFFRLMEDLGAKFK